MPSKISPHVFAQYPCNPDQWEDAKLAEVFFYIWGYKHLQIPSEWNGAMNAFREEYQGLGPAACPNILTVDQRLRPNPKMRWKLIPERMVFWILAIRGSRQRADFGVGLTQTRFSSCSERFGAFCRETTRGNWGKRTEIGVQNARKNAQNAHKNAQNARKSKKSYISYYSEPSKPFGAAVRSPLTLFEPSIALPWSVAALVLPWLRGPGFSLTRAKEHQRAPWTWMLC